MKRKSLLTVLLAFVLCFTIVFATNATQPTAKDLVLEKVKNFDLGYDKGFYDKSEGTTQFNIEKFNGTIKDELGDYTGANLELLTQLDSANNSIKFNYDTDIQGNTTNGDIFLKDDKLIFTKDLLHLLQSFGVDMEQMAPGFMGKAPQYLYVSDQQLSSIWEQMVSYQDQQLPEEYQEMLLFFIEAIPDKYFSISSGKLVLKLDQAGFEDVVFNLVTKVKNEKERFADIIVETNKYNFDNMGISAEDMREQIISGIANNSMPTEKDIKMIGAFVDVNLTYESAILPGGLKTFDMSIKLNVPDGSVNGVLDVKTESKGKSGNLNGTYDITGNFAAVDGPVVDVQLTSDYEYKGTYGKSDTIINVKAEDATTGELFCDISATSESTTAVKKDIVIAVPELTASNSLDLSQFLTTTTTTVTESSNESTIPKEKGYVNLVVNGEYVNADVQPYIKDGKRTMVPVKFVSEALGCNVQWLEPNEVRITAADGKVISMYIDQSAYKVNGVEKQLDVNPCIEDGNRTMVPVRFIVEELGATVEPVGNDVVITK